MRNSPYAMCRLTLNKPAHRTTITVDPHTRVSTVCRMRSYADHLIGDTHGAGPVRHQHHRLASTPMAMAMAMVSTMLRPPAIMAILMGERIDGAKNNRLIQRVKPAGGFVEQHQIRLTQEHPRQPDALTFAFGKTIAQLSYRSIKPLRQRLDKIKHGSLAACVTQALLKGIITIRLHRFSGNHARERTVIWNRQ